MCPFFFFNDTATTEIYTLSLHDALPISPRDQPTGGPAVGEREQGRHQRAGDEADRKSTRLNSSHTVISYAVFCLKKKKTKSDEERTQTTALDHTYTPLDITVLLVVPYTG